jgi:C4-dicarboxylate-specific signal transduction histidine kinase
VRGGEILRELRRFTNRHATAMELVDIGAVARDAARVVEHLARGLSVHVDVAIPVEARIIGEPVQIEQVLVNLLVNAVEAAATAAAPARRVEISATAAGKEIIVRVRDTGPGIDPADAAKLFSPFFSTKPDGLGMGLAISRAIAEAHGGSLVALPDRRRGAELLLSLPAAAPLERPPAAGEDDLREQQARSRLAAGRSGPSVA